MKKSTKIIRLSVTLLLLVAMLLTPMSPVFAVVIENGDADLTAADIVSEDASKREKFSRHYLTGDGTYFAVSYAEQVNYQDEDGNWIAVDNSLSTNVLTGEKTTKNDKFNVKFANKANKDDLVTIKTKEYEVSFGITVSEDGESYLELNKVKGTEIESNTSAEPKTTQEATSLGKAVSGITYFDAFSDYLDVRYSVAHEKVKEDLILERKSSFSSYKVTYNIKEKDALATLNDDGSITFTSPDGAVLFNVGVPVMYDSNGKSSADIAVSMTQGKKTVEVIYTPSAEWLNAEERSYPVTIDPETQVSNQETDNITDISVYYVYDLENNILSSNDRLYMGMDYYNYIKFNSVPTISSDDEFSGASLVFCGDYLYSVGSTCYVNIANVSEYWDENSFGYGSGQYNEINWIPTDNTTTIHNPLFVSESSYTVEFSLANFFTTSSGYSSFFNATEGFEIYMNSENEFRAFSSEYSTMNLRPCIIVRYGESASPEEPEDSEITAAAIDGTLCNDFSDTYRLKNCQYGDYLDISGTEIISSSYDRTNSNHKITFIDSQFDSTYMIQISESYKYIYYNVDAENSSSYDVYFAANNLPETADWKIYTYPSDDSTNTNNYIIVSNSDTRYVLTENSYGDIVVEPYLVSQNQAWEIEEFYLLNFVSMGIYDIYVGETWKLQSDEEIVEILPSPGGFLYPDNDNKTITANIVSEGINVKVFSSYSYNDYIMFTVNIVSLSKDDSADTPAFSECGVINPQFAYSIAFTGTGKAITAGASNSTPDEADNNYLANQLWCFELYANTNTYVIHPLNDESIALAYYLDTDVVVLVNMEDGISENMQWYLKSVGDSNQESELYNIEIIPKSDISKCLTLDTAGLSLDTYQSASNNNFLVYPVYNTNILSGNLNGIYTSRDKILCHFGDYWEGGLSSDDLQNILNQWNYISDKIYLEYSAFEPVSTQYHIILQTAGHLGSNGMGVTQFFDAQGNLLDRTSNVTVSYAVITLSLLYSEDIEATLLHELGHALGLDDLNDIDPEKNYPSVMQGKADHNGTTSYVTNVDRGSLIKRWGG